MSKDIGYSLRAAAKLAGVPTMTFHAWKEKGLITPDLTDDKGNFLFSEMMIERAKEIDAKRKAKKSANSSGNLFEDSSPVESVEKGEELPDETTPASLLQNSEATKGQLNSDFDSATYSPRKEKVIEVPSPVVTSETPTMIELAPASEIITLEDRANKIRQLQADVQRGIVEIGFELIAAKKEIGHGGWADWLATNFDWTQQTANRFMRVSERFGKLNNVVQFKPSTLQAMLSLPEGDEEAFIEAQADKGKPIESQSTREVKAAVKDWNQREAEETATFSSSEKNNNGGKIAAVVAPCVEEESISEDTPPASPTVNPANETSAPAEYSRATEIKNLYYETTEKLQRQIDETQKKLQALFTFQSIVDVLTADANHNAGNEWEQFILSFADVVEAYINEIIKEAPDLQALASIRDRAKDLACKSAELAAIVKIELRKLNGGDSDDAC